MNPCKECGSNINTIITETSFGHGDSGHKTYVKCNCGATSKEFSYWGFFRDEDLRSAQDDWNKNNPAIAVKVKPQNVTEKNIGCVKCNNTHSVKIKTSFDGTLTTCTIYKCASCGHQNTVDDYLHKNDKK